MQPVNIRSFKQRLRHRKKAFKKFLGHIEKKPPKNLDAMAEEIDKEVWREVDCLTCANCCKKMSPTFTTKDIKRIADHFEIKPSEFKDKWLYFDEEDGDWMNKQQPCQFLDLQTNMCSIYEVRPADCAGFPHLTKKKMVDYIHVHQQNIEYCPATFKMVEKMIDRVKLEKKK
ncbi:MAG: YkgJ family cysteine cluster protein [Sphingobacteriia bacterium]|nr:YkgJ family cysteine cluster protein [Sphingobacteriia bacterium]